MKFTVRRSSSHKYKEEVEINSLEDLKEFYDIESYNIIIDFDYLEIEIYDGYRE